MLNPHDRSTLRIDRIDEATAARALTADAWAEVMRLDSDLFACRSATAALEAWCARQRDAPPPVRARRMAGAAIPMTGEQRERLAVRSGEAVAYRRVQLFCGPQVLSEASNWYVPGRLTPAMNTQLDTSDVPFGRVVAALQPARATIAAERFWLSAAQQPIPAILFRHRALLLGPAGQPFAEVDEHYTDGLVALLREGTDRSPATSTPPSGPVHGAIGD